MQPLRLIRALFLLLLSFSSFASSDCRDVSAKSKLSTKSENLRLCFLKDDSYFISQNCQSMDCEAIQKLKAIPSTRSFTERPGATVCKALGGGVDLVLLDGKSEVQRCVIPVDQTTISLNLLESWNGKSFSGPASEMKF